MKKSSPRSRRRSKKKFSLRYALIQRPFACGIFSLTLFLGIFILSHPEAAKDFFVDTFFFFSTSGSGSSSGGSSENYTVIETGGTSFTDKTIVYKGFAATVTAVGTPPGGVVTPSTHVITTPPPSSSGGGGGGGGGSSSTPKLSPVPAPAVVPVTPVQPPEKKPAFTPAPAEDPFAPLYDGMDPNHWARGIIIQAFKERILTTNKKQYNSKGDAFNPDAPVNMAETVTVTLRALRIPLENARGKPLSDVDPSMWYSSYVYSLKKYGFFPSPIRFFGATLQVTRGNFLYMLSNLVRSDLKNFSPRSPVPVFLDVSPNDYRYKAIIYAVQSGFLKGYPNKTIGINKILSLSEILTILFRVRGYMEQGFISRTIPWSLPWNVLYYQYNPQIKS